MIHPLRALALLVLAVVVGLLCACNATVPAPLQTFNTLCPIVTNDLTLTSTMPSVPAATQALAAKGATLNKQICTSAASLNLADLKDFANTALPAISGVIAAIPPTPAFPSTAIALALDTFGPMVLQLAETIVPIAAASAVPAASAPTAASAP